MCCRNPLSLGALALILAWSLPAYPAPDETGGDRTPSDRSAVSASTGENDWDWDDLDLSGPTPPEKPPTTESAAETEWGWEDFELGGADGIPAEVSVPTTAEPVPTTDPELKSRNASAGSYEADSQDPPSPTMHEAEATEAETESRQSVLGRGATEEQEQPATLTTDTDDWDWDNIEEAAAEPVTETARRTRREDRLAALAEKPRPASTAEPDFDAAFEEGYVLFQGVGSFQVIPSRKDPDMHPCVDCHEWAESDLTKRSLKEPHDNFKLEHGLHGKGEFWCLTCHDLEGDGGLRTLEGLKLSFDEAYILCSQCHSQETKDWYFGAHGKRVGNWRGTRQILNCTACHYQHRPGLKPRKPLPGPTMRMGMETPKHWLPKHKPAHNPTDRRRIWERYIGKHRDQGHE